MRPSRKVRPFHNVSTPDFKKTEFFLGLDPQPEGEFEAKTRDSKCAGHIFGATLSGNRIFLGPGAAAFDAAKDLGNFRTEIGWKGGFKLQLWSAEKLQTFR